MVKNNRIEIDITKNNNETILNMFKNCKDTESVNLKTKNGFIYMVGGMLFKIDGKKTYMAMGTKWVAFCNSI